MALYYSLVTLSTLGYGDIVPTSPTSRMLAAMEALVGQVYLAVLVVRLVGHARVPILPWQNGGQRGKRP